jgi:hypothetical protein
VSKELITLGNCKPKFTETIKIISISKDWNKTETGTGMISHNLAQSMLLHCKEKNRAPKVYNSYTTKI